MKIAYILPSLAAKAPIFIAKRLIDYFISKGNEVEDFFVDEIFGTEFSCKRTRIKFSELIDFASFALLPSNMMCADFYVEKYYDKIKMVKKV